MFRALVQIHDAALRLQDIGIHLIQKNLRLALSLLTCNNLYHRKLLLNQDWYIYIIVYATKKLNKNFYKLSSITSFSMASRRFICR